MTEELFTRHLESVTTVVRSIQQTAHDLHASVNQTYGKDLPYSVHLDMVADMAKRYAFSVIEEPSDIVPVLFGAYFHDSIEDARLTYNDVVKIASGFMDKDHAVMAAEIVYALTNDKGRTRQERAGEKYYKGIRETAYAPLIKMCDRLANTEFSYQGKDGVGKQMSSVYASEYPHFIEAITSENGDIRYSIPQAMKDYMQSILCSRQ